MTAPISIRQQFGDRIALSHAPDPESVYRFGGLPKPCVHPLYSPGGTCLSGFQMSDHIWHRGLWFTYKFLNGTNFWEEDNHSSGVQATKAQPVCKLIDANTVSIDHALQWTSAATGVALEERRTLLFMQAGDVHFIDWSCELTAATAALKIDRTPYTTWGGYGGIAFRASRELHETNFLLPRGETAAALVGQPHDWCVMQASVDGGGAEKKVSIGIVDHPSNPRSPTPWYVKSANGFNFMNAAILFHEPMDLPRGQTLKFRYRVAYRDGTWTAPQFQELADAFRATGGQS